MPHAKGYAWDHNCGFQIVFCQTGIEYSASAVFCIVQAAVLFVFIRKNNLLKQYGLCKTSVPARRFLYYVPLFILATNNRMRNNTGEQTSTTIKYSYKQKTYRNRKVSLLCAAFYLSHRKSLERYCGQLFAVGNCLSYCLYALRGIYRGSDLQRFPR